MKEGLTDPSFIVIFEYMKYINKLRKYCSQLSMRRNDTDFLREITVEESLTVKTIKAWA